MPGGFKKAELRQSLYSNPAPKTHNTSLKFEELIPSRVILENVLQQLPAVLRLVAAETIKINVAPSKLANLFQHKLSWTTVHFIRCNEN